MVKRYTRLVQVSHQDLFKNSESKGKSHFQDGNFDEILTLKLFKSTISCNFHESVNNNLMGPFSSHSVVINFWVSSLFKLLADLWWNPWWTIMWYGFWYHFKKSIEHVNETILGLRVGHQHLELFSSWHFWSMCKWNR